VVDVFAKAKRSELMSRIRGRNTRPEKALWGILRRLGVPHRRHVVGLPGTPEVVLSKAKVVLFVHGCFWHGHPGCRRARLPASNRVFWRKKVRTNRSRDDRQVRRLRRLGWRIGRFWACRRIDGSCVAVKLRRLGVRMDAKGQVY